MIGSAAHFGNTPSGVNPHRRNTTHTPPHAPDDYRREARRLRHRYAKNPSLLHRRLHQLAQSHPATASPAEQSPAKSPSLAANSPAAWYFAHRVTARLQGGLLPYSHRIALLKEAHNLGIKRFEANLIIAVTQHRHRTTPAKPTPPTSRRTSLPHWLLPATLALTLQTALLTLLYYTLSK